MGHSFFFSLRIMGQELPVPLGRAPTNITRVCLALSRGHTADPMHGLSLDGLIMITPMPISIRPPGYLFALPQLRGYPSSLRLYFPIQSATLKLPTALVLVPTTICRWKLKVEHEQVNGCGRQRTRSCCLERWLGDTEVIPALGSGFLRGKYPQ